MGADSELKSGISVLVLVLSFLSFVSAQGEFEGMTTASQIATRLGSILCAIMTILLMVAAGIAIIIVVIQGIKWTASADDPGARKTAKGGIIHAIIGLIIVIIAVEVISMIVAGTDVIIMGCMY